jgi:hypothetical protein
VLAVRQRRSLFVIVPGLLYFAFASASSLQLGVRLVLPAWAMFLLLAGVAIDLLWITPWRRVILAGGAATVLTGMLATFPNGIAYFNSFAGGPREQLHYLADSNIDWGQGLRQAALWARYNGVRKLGLSYFGFDQPRRFFDGTQVELIAPPWNDRLARGAVLQPEPGWYAISATLLPGHFFQQKYRDYYSAFLRRKPDGMSGSIFFYRVD